MNKAFIDFEQVFPLAFKVAGILFHPEHVSFVGRISIIIFM